LVVKLAFTVDKPYDTIDDKVDIPGPASVLRLAYTLDKP